MKDYKEKNDKVTYQLIINRIDDIKTQCIKISDNSKKISNVLDVIKLLINKNEPFMNDIESETLLLSMQMEEIKKTMINIENELETKQVSYIKSNKKKIMDKNYHKY